MSGPSTIKFKYSVLAGKKIAKIYDKKSIIFLSLLIVFFVFLLFVSIPNLIYNNFKITINDLPIIVIFLVLFLNIIRNFDSNSICINLSNNKIFYERKILGARLKHEEFGVSNELILSLIPADIFLFGEKYKGKYYIHIGSSEEKEKNPLFFQVFIINKQEADKLSAFLNIKMEIPDNDSLTPEILSKIPSVNFQNISGSALMSLIMGILSLCLLILGAFMGIPAIIMGIKGLIDVKKNKKKGKTIAIIGIIAGSIGILISLIFFVNFFNNGGRVDFFGDYKENQCQEIPGYICTELSCEEYSNMKLNETGEYESYELESSRNCISNQKCCKPTESVN